ncbi:hypothetical protein F5B17DRAFT_394577 [Nemania serpens]|nr:hypothetical protein F5B17DRAFT_394577 [Nemania serpens]
MQGSIDTEVMVWSRFARANSDNAVQVRIAADGISATRDTRVETDKKLLLPDCSFSYEGSSSYPPVAFGVAWSQTTENLKKKAIELIQESAGEIRTVVGLDFSETYKIWTTIRDQVGTNRELPIRGPAKAFIWRAMFDENGEQLFNADGQPSVHKRSYIICDNDGNARPTMTLQLSLKDFIPLPVIKAENWDGLEVLSDTKLELDSATIVKCFDEALHAQKKEDDRLKPKRERKDREKMKVKQEREANRRAAAEKERGQRSILDMVNIGGHNLRRRARLD